MTYAAQLSITASTAWTTWHTASTHATEATEAAIAWYLDTFFSEKASARYEEIGKILGFAMVCTVACGMTARILVQSWIDAQVSAAIVEDTTESTAAMTGAEVVQAETEADFLEEMIAAIEETEQSTEGQPDYSTLTTPELRRECAAVGIRWKNARGQNRHLTKAQMIAALEGHQHAA